ncbi:TonB-dependent receptor plug domain-containing protein [Brevundimonas sp.]|jgi:iron complex outermembrane receptor protein|uniref:TonB-dependent receptor plug domain-containing protein n=1 Tax=Brevundimonas sp. TaxID=1871086 RepID=UPI0037C0EB67
MNNSRNWLGATAIAACISFAAPASAQDERTFDIAPGPLETALAQFAAQSDHQLLFADDLVANRRSEGVSGRLKVTEALDRLLAGTGLSWRQSRAGVFTLRRAAATPRVEVIVPPAALDDIIVTGSLLRQSGELASPVHVVDRGALDRSGRATVAELIAELPQNYAGAGTPSALLAGADNAGSNASVATGVNLRGLGPDSTLVLVDGRRLAGTGYRGDFADLSALPSAAVERVDVLLDGASALYGSRCAAQSECLFSHTRIESSLCKLKLKPGCWL